MDKQYWEMEKAAAIGNSSNYCGMIVDLYENRMECNDEKSDVSLVHSSGLVDGMELIIP